MLSAITIKEINEKFHMSAIKKDNILTKSKSGKFDAARHFTLYPYIMAGYEGDLYVDLAKKLNHYGIIYIYYLSSRHDTFAKIGAWLKINGYSKRQIVLIL